jgi:hypothetical protein
LGVSGLRANLKPHIKTDNLLPKIKEVIGSFIRNPMAKACMSFRSRMEAVFTADGSFIEYVDCQYVSLLIFFLLQENRLIFSCVVPFKRKKKKIPDLSLPPCTFDIFMIKNCYLLIPRPPYRTSKLQEKPLDQKRENPALQNMKFIFLWVIFYPPGSGSTDLIESGSETLNSLLVSKIFCAIFESCR